MPSIVAHVQLTKDLIFSELKCSTSSAESSRGAPGGRGMLWSAQRGWTGHCCRAIAYPRTFQSMLRVLHGQRGGEVAGIDIIGADHCRPHAASFLPLRSTGHSSPSVE